MLSQTMPTLNSHKHHIAALAIRRNRTGQCRETVRIDCGLLAAHKLGNALFELQVHFVRTIEAARSARTDAVRIDALDGMPITFAAAVGAVVEKTEKILRCHIQTVNAIDTNAQANATADEAWPQRRMCGIHFGDERFGLKVGDSLGFLGDGHCLMGLDESPQIRQRTECEQKLDDQQGGNGILRRRVARVKVSSDSVCLRLK